ncbi:polyprenyl synthetase family protein [Nonomuraea sp. NPDC049758]|uniref:polyprenyl synthetase family protein n=1 Tax=Nonomuraea sp. NPDC049758 TaxID=3154360 RepID=UPI003425ACA0
MFELSCRAGARLAGAPPQDVDALGHCGRALGLAFQAADDTLDVIAPQSALGKRPGTDLREGVYGLPVLISLHQSGPDSDRLRELLRRDDLGPAEQEEACARIAASGGISGASAIAWLSPWKAASASCSATRPVRPPLVSIVSSTARPVSCRRRTAVHRADPRRGRRGCPGPDL